MRQSQMIAAFVIALGATAASADFVPGRFYAPRFPMDGSSGFEGIWEFDPVTGTSRLFAETESFGRGVTGLTFTPDGSQLLASVWSTSQIIGFDSSGAGEVVLDSDDGISLPQGSNNIAYDQFGNFFVKNSFPSDILRFAPDGSPGTVFADVAGSEGSIAPAPDGSLYHIPSLGGLYHVLTFGVSVLIDGSAGGTVATASNGDVYVINVGGVFRYPLGDGGAREFLAPAPQGTSTGFTTIGISPDQQSLIVYTLHGTFYSVDRYSGATSYLGGFPLEDELYGGPGLAIAIPEPKSLTPLFLGGILCMRFWIRRN